MSVIAGPGRHPYAEPPPSGAPERRAAAVSIRGTLRYGVLLLMVAGGALLAYVRFLDGLTG